MIEEDVAVLAPEFSQLTQQLAGERARLKALNKSSVRVYLLFERWQDNPLAAHFAANYAQQAAARFAVPDDYYKDQPDDAPCLVPIDSAVLPLDSGQSFSDYLAYEWFAEFLQQAWQAAQLRASLQGLCAVLFAPVDLQILGRHLVQLGHQNAPDRQARLLRYQDPRVFQRIWPVLNQEQKNVLLGPIYSWWSLQMPWGAIEQKTSAASAAKWFVAAQTQSTSDARPTYARSALFSPQQWLTAHSAAAANALWRRYAQQEVPISRQPDGMQMNALVAIAAEWGIHSNQLETFLQCLWHPRLACDIPPSTYGEDAENEQLKKRAASLAHLIGQYPEAGYMQLLQKLAE